MSLTTETAPTPETHGVTYIDPVGLVPHPLLAGMPPVWRDDPATAGFIETIRTAGRIDLPALLDDQGRILDGRRRRLAAEVLGLPLPAKVVPGAEAATVVLHCLAGRRNLTKGALAYLSLPLLEPAIEEARQRQKHTLRRGADPVVYSVHHEKNVRSIAKELGISKELLHQAARVHKLFKDETRRELGRWRNTFSTYRQHFEPKIISGEIGLGGVLQSVATKGCKRAPYTVPERFARGVFAVNELFAKRWDDLTPEVRRESSARIVEEVSAWPDQVRDDLHNYLTKQAEIRGAAKAPPF